MTTLAHAPNTRTGLFDLADAARAAGLTVHSLLLRDDGWIETSAVRAVAGPGTAYFCAGGPLAAAMSDGVPIRLAGATAAWFAGLPVEVAGRRWVLGDVAAARAVAAQGAGFVKLAEAKFRALPARRYRSVAELDDAPATVNAPNTLQLLATADWLPIASEYRVFTLGRQVLTWSPYLVEDDPWSPLLHTHRASFHDQAARLVADLLAAQPTADVPPTAVIDVARLDDGRFVVLEVNHVWSSGLYGCDPNAALRAVIDAVRDDHDPRWVWQPDPAVAALHR